MDTLRWPAIIFRRLDVFFLIKGSSLGIKRTGHVPATTYVSPIPRKAYERSRSASRRGIDLLKEATTPPGIKVHEASSNRAFDLRHSRCRVEKMTTTGARRVSPPDFGKLHAQMDEKLRKTSPKPTTVAVPFNFVKPPVSRHRDCVAETTSPQPKPWRRSKSSVSRTPVVVSNYAAQLREELNRAKQTEINGNNNGNVWSETNKQKVAAFLASRSKSSEDIAARTREKMQQQKERTRDYLRQLAEMKQRVLNGPLVMERQTALAQEHRFQRRFQQRMRSANLRIDTEKNNNHKRLSRHDSQASNATFVAVGHSSNQDHQDSLQNPYDDSSESELAPSKEKSSAQNSERSSVSSGSSSSKSSASSSASTSSSASSHGSRSTS
ncbi:unnamed protein product [Caenorhabditis auriculariae]|uniref:Uncharacterized protein n=1 Tax=Caenorhabditis auriculariae TaxID=2777116 RepID=A0A8S1H8V9_9PELO|nr:unnamed protein product [Caenorhabditis auriculariae]